MVALCSGNQRGGGVFETDNLVSSLTDADELKMDIQKGSGAKDNSGPFLSTNPPISVAEPNHFHPKWTQDLFLQPKYPPLHIQMSTHQFHYITQQYLEVGSSKRLWLHHNQVRIFC